MQGLMRILRLANRLSQARRTSKRRCLCLEPYVLPNLESYLMIHWNCDWVL